MDPNIEVLASGLKDLLKGRLGRFLDDNKEKKEFLEERARRLAELTVELARAKTDGERALVAGRMDVVKDTIQNELYAAAVSVSAEFRSAVGDVLGTAVDWGLKIAPGLLKALASKLG